MIRAFKFAESTRMHGAELQKAFNLPLRVKVSKFANLPQNDVKLGFSN